MVRLSLATSNRKPRLLQTLAIKRHISHNWEIRGKEGSRHGDQRFNDGMKDADSFHFSALLPSRATSPVVIRVHASLFTTIRKK